ncbi:peptidase S9, partial [candidate division BRC1 bacterium SM23_51]
MTLLASALCSRTCYAEQSPVDKSLLTLDRIFSSDEFEPEKPPAIRWRERGLGYTTLEKVEDKEDRKQLVWHDPATGRREILVPPHLLIPPGETAPLVVEAYSLSDDGSKLLIYTNSKRVWRTKSRGDYWVLDIAARELKKLGGDAPPSTLMFAEFSPDGRRVCYVRDNNLYVQNLNDLQITLLTRDGSETVINGTFDWVYEEEFRLRKGFRWSPDSRSIAYWQIDPDGVGTFYLINNTDGLYSRVIPIRYPKVGEKNPAARVGVVSADGGETGWLDLPGDPRNHYIAHMDWAESSDEIVLQQFNRLQNVNRVILADAKSGKVTTILTETDSAWVEDENDVRWIENGKKFIWLSERDGWRHAYAVARSGKQVSLITKGDFDVIGIEGVDEENQWLYYLASPDNPTQRYLYRVSLDGRRAERVTPANCPGTHTYRFSPDAKWAVHTYSTLDRPPVVEVISLPDHKRVKVLAENKKLLKNLDALKKPGTEFFRIDIGNDVLLDGWCIKPPDFDPEKKYPVLFHVYGEPPGQTVLDHWPKKKHLWHWMLAQQGYLVVSVDNRGTPAPRGRDWRKCIHRQVGIL